MKNKRKIKLPAPSRAIFNVCNYLFFGAFTFLCIYPLWYVFIYSISDPQLTSARRVVLYPQGISLTNLVNVLQIEGLGHAVFVSVLRTVVGTCATVFVCMLLGYVFSKEHFPARKFLYRMLIITMYVNGGMIPTYLTYKTYGLLNSFWVYILPALVSAYHIILIKTYVEQIPISLEESARIDGASYLTVLTRIIIPMAKPIVATVAVYNAVGQWNNWFDNHIYNFSKKELQTLQYLLYKYMNEAERMLEEMERLQQLNVDITQFLTPFGLRMTITLITVIPVLMIYPLLQRYIIKGVMIGAVKG